ncbi:DUF885 domain-containing protein, partial [Sphingorhabdus sp.]
MRKPLITLALLLASTNAHADAGSDLKALVNDYWQSVLKESPVLASSLGDDRYANEIGDYSLAASDRRAKSAEDYLKRLDAIPQGPLSASDRIEYGILKRTLAETVEGNRFGQRAINFSTYSGWHQSFAGLADNIPLKTKADFESYNRRLKQYARANDESIAVANTAIKGKYTLPCEVLNGYEKGIKGLIVADADIRKSRYMAPYHKPRPDSISEADFYALAGEAGATIATVIHPALQKHLDWYRTSYLPACAKQPGVSAQPGGLDYYNFQIRSHTTTTKSADEIHALGQSEVARIRAEMQAVATKAGYPSREAMIQSMRTDPKYFAKSPEELMEKSSRVAKIIDGKMPSLFHRLPRLPYGLREIPAEIAEGTTTAYYSPGSPAIGVSGTYYVNTSKLDQRPLWEIPALTVHEAVPGHHNQIALQQELELSDFRKNGAFFTAFVEGWGLYSERLGIEMGLYDT